MADTEKAELSFEAALEKLEQLVREMETGTLPLEAMIARFEEASRLAALCRGKLDGMSKKIEILLQENARPPVYGEFDPSSGRRGGE